MLDPVPVPRTIRVGRSSARLIVPMILLLFLSTLPFLLQTTWISFTEPNGFHVSTALLKGVAANFASPQNASNSLAQSAVSGMVFEDTNANGFFDSSDTGVAGITLNAYDATGAVVATTVSDGAGLYSLAVPAGATIRLEATDLSADLVPGMEGPGAKTTVQFLTAPATQANVALSREGGCNNPRLATTCFTNGLRNLSGNHSAIVSFPYDRPTSAAISKDVAVSEVGSVWGLAYAAGQNKLYASAILKRHVDLGPLGLGGIYVIDYTSGTPLTSSFYTVPNTGAVNRPADLAGLGDPSLDTDAFAKVGKVGLGDIDISDDGQTLWAVNLNTRKVVKIDLSNPAAPQSVELANTPDPACPNGLFRPWALKVHKGNLYLGGVCTGEQRDELQNLTADLSAKVYQYNPNADSWSTPLIDFPLAQRGPLVASNGRCNSWRSWVDTFVNSDAWDNGPTVGFQSDTGGGPFRCRAQPILADLEFADDSRMILQFQDRTGHQLGYVNKTPDGALSISSNNGGDILLAANVNGSWVLEENGAIPALNLTSAGGQNNGEGPGNGEFFYQNTGGPHTDPEIGGIALLPGSEEVVSVVADPDGIFGGGAYWHSLTNGSKVHSLAIYQESPGVTSVGKANGLGDLELLCDPMPIEIGNYVWLDTNGNGIQDPGETPLGDVTVELVAPNGAILATALTDLNGNYYFSSAEGMSTGSKIFGISGLTPYTTGYQVRINLDQPRLTIPEQLAPTIPNADGHTDNHNVNDNRDSDGQQENNYSVVRFQTDGGGSNNHTLDFGFVLFTPPTPTPEPTDTPLPPTETPTEPVPLTPTAEELTATPEVPIAPPPAVDPTETPTEPVPPTPTAEEPTATPEVPTAPPPAVDPTETPAEPVPPTATPAEEVPSATPEVPTAPPAPCTDDNGDDGDGDGENDCGTPTPTPAAAQACLTGITGRIVDIVGAGIPAWTVHAQSTQDPEQRFTTVTDGTGTFIFADLTPGLWTISYELQGGWLPVSAGSSTVMVTEGAGCTGISFTIQQTPVTPTPAPQTVGCLTGYHQQDYQTYSGFGGNTTWEVVIYPAGQAEPRYTTATDSTGYVRFPDLVPGSWVVEQVRTGGTGALSRSKFTVTVAAGPTCTTFYLGLIEPPRYPDPAKTPNAPIPTDQTGCVAGQVIDDNHVALSGWTVKIKPAAAETPLLQTTSDGLGQFYFRGLTPGEWMLWQQTPEGWTAVTANNFTVSVQRDPACTNVRFKNRASADLNNTQ